MSSDPQPRPALGRGELLRQCRIWHGYLSAFAFLSLLFFAVTGLSLNHPGWFRAQAPPLRETTLQLAPLQVAQVRSASDPGRALAALAAESTPLRGTFKDAELAGDSLFVRLQGVRGSSDLQADLATGRVTVTVETAAWPAVADALHRGELAAPPWRLLIDIAAVLLIVVSLVGYTLFLSLRARWRTAVALTILSGLAGAGVFLILTA